MNFKNIFFSYKKRIDQLLNKFIDDLPLKNSILYKAIKYSLLNEGKRLRPLLVYIIGKTFNADLIDLDIPAIAIECIHNYSLIHDDLPSMDNDNIRRGKLSCHIKYGEDIAILAGNSLQSLAFYILSKEPMPNVNLKNRILMINILAKFSGIYGICGGQSLDLRLLKKNINLITLEKIYSYKTISLIKSSVILGLLATNKKNHKFLPELNFYAENIGLAFQIQNDIIDIIGCKKNNNINKGSDEKLKKNTYPKITSIKTSKLKILSLYHKAIKSLNKLNDLSIDTSMLKDLAKFIIKSKY